MLTYLHTMLRTWIRSFIKDERGATMVEYGLIIALIAIALVGALTLLTGGISSLFNSASKTLRNQ